MTDFQTVEKQIVDDVNKSCGLNIDSLNDLFLDKYKNITEGVAGAALFHGELPLLKIK